MKTRGSGILLHISSLPAACGIGDMGPSARGFVDFLVAGGQHYWQILPLNPTDPLYDNSPYHSLSAFAFNPLLISPEQMAADGYLAESELGALPVLETPRQVEYEKIIRYKMPLFSAAYQRFRNAPAGPEYAAFCRENDWWLEDFALFTALREEFAGRDWIDWPDEYRDRDPETFRAARTHHAERVGLEKFIQFVFFGQWRALKRYCNERSVHLIGDLPIYVDYEGVDLWCRPDLFKLDAAKRPRVVSGVPPDYFSATGQLWGNPIYDWEALRRSGYKWWNARIAHNLQLFDYLRIDHFRGLVAAWEVPAGAESAVGGQWVANPVTDFLRQLFRTRACLPIIAEDLGLITPDVREVMRMFDLPGMKVLMFAFGDDMATNPYIPHNVPPDSIYYTGTHDNNTLIGWFEHEIGPEERGRVFGYLGREATLRELPWEMIRLVMMSVANTAIIPLQDILGLDQSARMNRPSTCRGNWRWRLEEGLLQRSHGERLLAMARTYGRA